MQVYWKRKESSSATATTMTTSPESRKALGEQARKRQRRSVEAKDKDDAGAGSDLFQALFPIYHLNKICGLLPVTFVEQAPGKYHGRLYCFGIFYSVCLLTVLIAGEIWGLWRDLRDGWEHSTRLKSQTAMIVTCSDVLGVMILTSVSVLGSIFRWKHMQSVMDKLVEVDEKLGIVSPRKTRRFSVSITVASLAYIWLVSILDFYCWDYETKLSKKPSDKGAVNYIGLYFMYTVILAMEVQYAVSTYNVGQRVDRLNRSLEGILKSAAITEHFWKDLGLAGDLGGEPPGAHAKADHERLRAPRRPKISAIRYPTISPPSPSPPPPPPPPPPLLSVERFMRTARTEGRAAALRSNDESLADTVSHLVAVHATLCDAVSSINSGYGLAMLVVTLTCLLHLIITPYFLILEADGKREWFFLLVQGLWCILHIYRILIIVQPTYDAASKAKRTAVLVSQLLLSTSDAHASKQLEIFSLQLLHRPLEFSACGLFALDRALVTSIAGAVTTYLVILIQFQKADDQKGEISSVDSIIKNATQILRNASSLHNLTNYKFNA